jgi:hypothetical protein
MPYWRKRREAIGRKGEYEAELLRDSEVLTPVDEPVKPMSNMSSPTSVAFSFDIEIQPLVMPGAWSVVGKGGKTLRNTKTYDEPERDTLANKKKKKHRTRKPKPEEEPLSKMTLEDLPSSSKCLIALNLGTSQKAKQMHRAKEAKSWVKYQQNKQLKREALEQLIAGNELFEGLCGNETVMRPKVQRKPPMDNKANSSKDKARRHARSAAAAARCYTHDEEEGIFTLADRTAKGKTALRMQSSSELPKVAPRMGDKKSEIKLGEWTTIGKRGKPVNEFPPLALANKDTHKQQGASEGTKRRKGNEGPKQLKVAKSEAGGHLFSNASITKMTKCSVA